MKDMNIHSRLRDNRRAFIGSLTGKKPTVVIQN